MRYIVNKLNTVRWDEIPAETFLEWATTGITSKTEKDEMKNRVNTWLQAAKHGSVFVLGENRIIAINLT